MILILALALAVYGVYLCGMAVMNRAVGAWHYLAIGLLAIVVALLAAHHGSRGLAVVGCILAGGCFCAFAYYFDEKEV